MEKVNCIGLKCPIPILKTRLILNSMKKGEQLSIEADDPGFCNDFDLFAFQSSVKILNREKKENYYIFNVEVL